MNTFWICSTLVLLGGLIARHYIQKAGKFARGPVPFPKPILRQERPLSDRLASRDMEAEIERWRRFKGEREAEYSGHDIDQMCRRIEQGWRP